MSQKSSSAITAVGIDIGKNSFHIVGHDRRGVMVLRQKWSRGQARRARSGQGMAWQHGSEGKGLPDGQP